jgi:protease-4
MKKFLIGLLTGIILTGLAAIVFVFSLLRFGERRPQTPDGATLVLELNSDIPEKSPVEIPIPFFGTPPPLTMHDLWTALNRAASDPKVRAVVLIADEVDAGWAKLQELRADLLAFRKSGKPLVAWLRSPGTREYYLATAADKIYMSPEDYLDMKGLRAEMSYFRDTLNKLGVQVEVQHVGRYKDFGDMFTETGMSPETREVIDSLLDNFYAHLVETIASARKRDPAQVRAIIDEGPFTAKQAAAKGLVDALRFEDQVFGELKDRIKQGDLKKFGFRDYIRSTPGPDRGARRRIAWVVGEGTIVRGSGSDAMGSDEGFSSGSFIRMLRRVANERDISGVILRIDSPGGDAFASDEILREVKLLREKKPMVVSMSDTAASGGYYVSMTGDPVIAYPNTLTGSIGVVWGKLNLRGFYDKLGIRKEILTRGRNAAIDSTYAPMTPEGRAKLQQGLEEFYQGFVSKVAESRRRKYEQVEPLAQGRVWLGSQARERGLIDELGGIDKAVELIKAKAKIPAGDRVTLVPYPPKRTLWEQYLRSTSEQSVEARIRSVLGGFDYRLWEQGGIMRIMPFTIDIR